LEVVSDFVYLGSCISENCRSEKDISRRIGIAASKMGNLSNIWKDRHLSRQTKLKLYNSLILPVVMYGSETWTLTKNSIGRLDAFDMRCLRQIEGIKWWDRISNETIRDSTKQPPVTQLISQRRLSLLGHLARTEPIIEPIRILQGNASRNWKRPRGRPPARWMDAPMASLKDVGVNKDNVWFFTQDRSIWRNACRAATHLPGARD